ncbi:winged helix-turn-helix transcriptional regulator [Spirillospora sp. CA-253888]
MTQSTISNAVPPAVEITLSDKVLSDRLSHLTQVGVDDRRRAPGWPPRTHYRLTPQGHRLGPVLQALWD